MTVAEMIAALQKLPADSTVQVDDGNDTIDIEDIVVGDLGIVYIEIPGL